MDLVDFSLTSTRIWSVFRNEDGYCSAYSALLSAVVGKGSHWIPVVLEPIPDTNDLPTNADVDPRQMYLEHIFYPGRFPLNIISKALSVSFSFCRKIFYYLFYNALFLQNKIIIFRL